MSTLNFRIGDLCEVSSEHGVGMSKVQDILDDEHYLIDFPLREGSLEFFHEQDVFSVSVLRADELGNTCSYKFDALVQGRSMMEDNIRIPVLKIKRTSEIIKTQRRNFFRINYNSPVVVKIPDPQHNAIADFDANMMDISGGGIKLKSDEKLPNTKVELIFNLLDLNVTVDADFVGSDYIADNQYYMSRYKFSGISSELQEKIVSRLTKLQSDMLKHSMSRYENQRNSNILNQEVTKQLEMEEKIRSQMMPIKLICVVESFFTVVLYLFTMPTTSYPLDKLFGVAPRINEVSQFYGYTVIAAAIGMVLSLAGFYWNNKYRAKISANGFFIINLLINTVFLALGIMEK